MTEDEIKTAIADLESRQLRPLRENILLDPNDDSARILIMKNRARIQELDQQILGLRALLPS